ncbi:MAG: sulfotransferase [Rhizomicrobium sp.]|jgi:tetratricopeptide (TPR) repeat protein
MPNTPASDRSNQPALLQEYLRGADAAMRAGDQARAMQLGEEAARRGLEHPNLLVLAGYRALDRGVADDALALLQRARELAPRNVDVLNALGLALARLSRQREAVAVYDAALRQSPATPMLHYNKACALEDLSELTRARNEFERTLELQPAHAESLTHLATIAALRGDGNAARDFATRALRHNPGLVAAALALAMADIEEKKLDAALVRLKPLMGAANVSGLNRSIAQGLAGDALDGLGRPSEAFLAYTASNATMRELVKPIYERPGAERAPERVERLTAYFRAADPQQWRARQDKAIESPVRTHVFLVGFPRSGTTLLEQVLASHPDIETMEERDCLLDGIDEFVVPPDGLARLATADESDLARLRKAYWTRAREAGYAPRRAIFVDKMPLNTVVLCLIAKLFPQAKILFALRDPRDCVLSCFRRRFAMSPQMYELLTLEGAGRYYAAVMRLGEIYRDKLALDTLALRYEDMVADFEGETRRVCDFLGVDWREEMRAFAEKTRARDVNTPSAAQVARGLFSSGAGQWRHYRRELAPVLPELAPWIARFGYLQDEE